MKFIFIVHNFNGNLFWLHGTCITNSKTNIHIYDVVIRLSIETFKDKNIYIISKYMQSEPDIINVINILFIVIILLSR